MVRRRRHDPIKSCFDTCCIFVLVIGFFALAGGIAMTAVGGAGASGSSASRSSSSNTDNIGDFNTLAGAYSETHIDTLLSSAVPSAKIDFTPSRLDPAGTTYKLTVSSFTKKKRTVSVTGETARITAPNPSVGAFLEGSMQLPRAVLEAPQTQLRYSSIAAPTLGNLDAATSSFPPEVDLFRSSSSLYSSVTCPSTNTQPCDVATFGPAQCLALRGPTSYFSPLAGGSATCAPGRNCGACYQMTFAECVSLLLSPSGSGTPGRFAYPQWSAIGGCSSDPNGLAVTTGYSRGVTYVPPSSSFSIDDPATYPTIRVQIFSRTDPYVAAQAAASSIKAFTNGTIGSIFTVVDQKAARDRKDDDEKSSKRTLMAIGIVVLVISAIMMCVGIVCVSCGDSFRYCLRHGGMGGYYIDGGVMEMTTTTTVVHHGGMGPQPYPPPGPYGGPHPQQPGYGPNGGGPVLLPPQQHQPYPNNGGYAAPPPQPQPYAPPPMTAAPHEQAHAHGYQYSPHNNVTNAFMPMLPGMRPPEQQHQQFRPQQQPQQQQQQAYGYGQPQTAQQLQPPHVLQPYGQQQQQQYGYGYGQPQQHQQQPTAVGVPLAAAAGNGDQHPNSPPSPMHQEGGGANVSAQQQQQQPSATSGGYGHPPPSASAPAPPSQSQPGYFPPAGGVEFGGNPTK